MRLSDPLQGYKLASGISSIHFAYFIAILTLPSYGVCDPLVYTEAVNYLFIAHLTCFILSFLSWFSGFSGAHFLSSFLDFAIIIFYQGSIFYGQYAYFTPLADSIIPDIEECSGVSKSAYLMWLEIEIATFYGFIFAGILYLFLATIFSVHED
jgi:hypothetical protein